MSNLLIQNIHLSFNGRLILTDVSMSCQQGETVAIIGQSAEGKSSLLKIIYGTRRADHQEIYLDKEPLTKSYLQTRQFHLVPASFFIPGYIRARQIAEIYDWSEEDFGLLRELAPIERTRLRNLTQSQRKLIEIVALLNAPGDFLLLDEPYTMLEKAEENLLNRLVQRKSLKKGIIMTFTPHQSLPKFTDKLYELIKGHLIRIEDWGEKELLNP